MSDYTQTTDFSAKDALATGNANKVVKGSEVDTELSAISTAIATKVDEVGAASVDNVATFNTTGGIKDSGTGISSVTKFPSGTKMVFYQSSAPAEWTLVALGNTYALINVEDGTAGTTAGTHNPTVMNVVPSHTHTFTTNSGGSHTHSQGATTMLDNSSAPSSGGSFNGSNGAGGLGGTTQSGGSHTHTGTTAANGSASNWTPRRAAVRICSKD